MASLLYIPITFPINCLLTIQQLILRSVTTALEG